MKWPINPQLMTTPEACAMCGKYHREEIPVCQECWYEIKYQEYNTPVSGEEE